MQYATGQTIKVGDEVVADGMKGVIVCDFDNRDFAEGYEEWDMPMIETLGGGTLSSGVMVETVEAGMIHYVDGSGVIDFIQPAAR
ncbi:hypothetical protein [Mesorhizobium loti]|uniref:Uncharacterized protein n=1 Tax=Mesorhizobium loti R88b TaxID=935548 RepID=A0A6M7WQB2_RHILI|nr:hypothetical protein [Mesorhizobium loti]QKD02779.1 hypothetical protein EB235_15730 [Mesorhizobium loti R88b]